MAPLNEKEFKDLLELLEDSLGNKLLTEDQRTLLEWAMKAAITAQLVSKIVRYAVAVFLGIVTVTAGVIYLIDLLRGPK